MSYVEQIFSWVEANTVLLSWLAAISVITFIGTLIIIPILVINIPKDYFLHEKRKPVHGRNSIPGFRLLLVILKNILGLIFILAGIAMLVLPGQGLLTILIGLVLVNFPGKYYLERKVIQQNKVLATMNWIRVKANRPPVDIEK